MFFVYLLKSKLFETYYIGQTDDLEQRLGNHNSGRVRSTASKKPWNLIKYEQYNTRNEARWREYTLKHNTNERKKFYGV